MPPKLIGQGLGELFPQARRSEGKHVSHAIRDIMQSLYPDVYTDKPIDMTRANLGNALERAIIDGLIASDPDRYLRPGELEMEDWYGTPDLWDLGPNHKKNHKMWRTREIKLTWYSLNKVKNEGIEGEWAWKWWVQLKAYCHMAGQTRGALSVGFINGDYSRGDDGGPTILTWEDEWPEHELLENWEMLKARC